MKFIIRMLFVLALVAGCSKNDVPTTQQSKQETLILVIGGLGFDQTADISKELKKSYPDGSVVDFEGRDTYKTDISKYLKSRQYNHLVLIGHSFGGAQISAESYKIDKIDLAVFVDPVGFGWTNLTPSGSIKNTLYFKKKSGWLPPTADITSIHDTYMIDGGHNDVPHDPSIIPIIKEYIDKYAR